MLLAFCYQWDKEFYSCLPIFARDTFQSGDLLVGFAIAARHFGTMGFDVPAGILINRFGLQEL